MVDAGHFETMFRLNLVRMMIRHRDIALEDIAAILGVQETYVVRIVNGSVAKWTKDYGGLLDRVEEAITLVSDSREEMCQCSDADLLHLRKLLREDG